MNEAYGLWKSLLPACEVVLVSTCNRVEIYAIADESAHLDGEQLRKFVSVFANVAADDVSKFGQLLDGLDVVQHLSRVT